MTSFPSDVPFICLDSLGDVQGFSSADAGVAYSFYRDTIGGTYRPLPASAAAACVDPAGGLEKDGEGCLSINPDGSPEESGISLATSGVTVTNRVISTGDTMTGSLTITNGNLSINAAGSLGTDIDVVQSTNLPDGGIRVRKPITTDEYYEQGWNTANLYEFRHVDAIGADTKIFELTDQRITSVLNPINTTDAANKDYVDSATCVEADGGLFRDVGGCLAIKPNGTPDDSGVGLSTDGLLITNRVKNTGDTMTGALNVFYGTLSLNMFAAASPDLDIIQSVAIPTGGIRIRNPSDNTESYQQGWNVAGNYELAHNNGGFTSIFEIIDQRITSLIAPINPADAVNKAYVDTVAKTGKRLAICEVGGGQAVTTTDNFNVGTVLALGRVFITPDEITLPANENFMLDSTYDFTISGPAKTYGWHIRGGVAPPYTYALTGAVGRVNAAGDNIMRAVTEVTGPAVVSLRLISGEPAMVMAGQLTVLYLGQHV